MNTAYLLLGSNEGDRKKWLDKAIEQIIEHCGSVVLQSNIYETAAWGIEDQPIFLNQALSVQTDLSAISLLNTINNIESSLGRQRTEKWGQRTLDIDILFYNDEVIKTSKLTVPHPELQNRMFALVPLQEIAPNFLHPIYNKTINTLLQECPDKLDVRVFS